MPNQDQHPGCSYKPLDIRLLSATLWSIVKDDEVDQFYRAVDIAHSLFNTLPNLISSRKFCDLVLDLKIKALIHLMSPEDEIDHVKAFNLLNNLFPIKDVDVKMGSQYQLRHRKVRTKLLQLLAEEENRRLYMNDFLKYWTCGCVTRLIQNRVKQFVDIVDHHLETAADADTTRVKPVQQSLDAFFKPSKTRVHSVPDPLVCSSYLATSSSVTPTESHITETERCAKFSEVQDMKSKKRTIDGSDWGCHSDNFKQIPKSKKLKCDED